MFEAGAPHAALELLATAELTPLDELQSARLERLRAEIAFARTRGGDAPALLLHAAGASSRSTPRWRARPISRRSWRRCTPAA